MKTKYNKPKSNLRRNAVKLSLTDAELLSLYTLSEQMGLSVATVCRISAFKAINETLKG